MGKSRNFHAVSAHFRTSAGPMKKRQKENDQNWRQLVVDAEADVVHPEEIELAAYENEFDIFTGEPREIFSGVNTY